MTKELYEEIINHIEFLGYEVEDLKLETGHTFLAKSQNKSNLVVRVFNNNTFITARWNGYQLKALKSKEFYQVINAINQQVITKWYYEEDKEKDEITIVIEADYYDYNKSTFGAFVENFESEIRVNLQQFNGFSKTTEDK